MFDAGTVRYEVQLAFSGLTFFDWAGFLIWTCF